MQFTVSVTGRVKGCEKLSSRDTRHRPGVALGRDFSTMAPGSFMRHSTKQIFGFGCLCVALMGAAACSPRRIPSMTVEDLMEDRVTLDGIMMKCNQNPEKLRNTSDCENARVAVERLASQNVDPTAEKKRQQEFERAREQLRLATEKQRQEQEDKTKVDAYSLPVVPVTPAAAPNGSAPAASGRETSGGAQPGGSSPPLGNAGMRADPPALAGTTTP
jgi:hypothetical protein